MSFDQYRDRRYLPALDALRAVSVLLVITCHVHIGSWAWVGGEKGVTIFFILSGYLITFLALREERKQGILNLTAFYVRRSFRIFPLYYFVLALYLLIIVVLRAAPDKYANFTAALPYYLLYLQEYPFFFGVNGVNNNISYFHSWSLGIEEKFYLIWPVMIFIFFRSQRRLRLPICVVLAIFCIAGPWIFGRPEGSMIFPYFNILCGCWLALLLDDPTAYASLRALATPSALLISSAVLLVFQFGWPVFKIFPYDYPIDIAYALCATAFIGSVLLNGALADRLLGRAPLLLIGRLSYGMYLVHVLCLNTAGSLTSRVARYVPEKLVSSLNMLLVVCVTIVVSWILSKTVEQPMIEIGRRISARVLDQTGRA